MTLQRSPMPPRTRPLVATTELRRTTGLSRGTGLERGAWGRPVPLVKNAATRKAETGFSRKTKLLVRTRAGGGDPEQAMCEACGIWLGRRHGQVHHRANRGAGGCADEVVNSCANAALLCGTPFAGCHGKATANKLGDGFVLKHGTTPEYDPRNISILLASPHGSGVAVWLAEDGKGPDGTGYLLDAPEAIAA